MKVGIIFCSYGTLDLTPASLAPWIDARDSRLDGHAFVIVGVSCPFSGFPDAKDDGTLEYLQKCQDWVDIDHLVTSNTPISETEARGRALRWLAAQGCDLSIMVDADEFWTTDQITKAVTFMEERPFLCWARVCLKNYVFNKRTYLVDPFQPPRIHRLTYQSVYRAIGFEQDNDVRYEMLPGGALVGQEGLPHATVPRAQVWVPHLSWISDERSRKKCAYQQNRWGHCSFLWDDSQGGLIWNPALPIPETATDT